MAAKRRLETLDITEINRLMQLVIEARLRSYQFNPGLAHAYAALAAECRFELWSRQRARQVLRGGCGRSLSPALIVRRAGRHH